MSKKQSHAAAKQFDQFLGIQGGLCPTFGFVEVPYSQMLIQTIISFLCCKLFTYIKIQRGCGDDIAPPVTKHQIDEIDKRGLKLKEMKKDGEVTSLNEYSELVDKLQNEIQESSQKLKKRQKELDDTACKNMLVSYWSVQLIQSLVSLVLLMKAGFFLDEKGAGLWHKYNLIVYALANSSVFMTGAQCVADLVTSLVQMFLFQYAQNIAPVKECCGDFLLFLEDRPDEYWAKEEQVKEKVKEMRQSIIDLIKEEIELEKSTEENQTGKHLSVLIVFLVIMLPAIITHAFPFLIIYLLLPIAICIVLDYICADLKAYILACCCAFSAIRELACQMIVVLLLQTAVSVMSRLYAGQGYLTSVTYDVTLRTYTGQLECYKEFVFQTFMNLCNGFT